MNRIIPVLDVMNGMAVHAIGGRRNEYQPIKSTIVDNANPIAVAKALLRVTGSTEIYIADLDAIRSDGRISKCVRDLFSEVDATIWLDHGLRTEMDLQEIPENVKLVAGTETLESLEVIESLLSKIGPQRVIVSLDLFNTQPFQPLDEIVEHILALGISTLIVLDLASVGGTLTKPPLDYNSHRLRHPGVELIHGGGVRSRDDFQRLAGVDGVLCATAIHAGRLP